MNEILILSTTNTMNLAQKIASALVRKHEAACVNIVPGIKSIYFWEGKKCEDEECLLLIKSSSSKFSAVQKRIRQLHTYQVPEIIALPITAGDQGYLDWMRKSLGRKEAGN